MREELRRAAQEFIEAGFAGTQLRVHDERGEWTGSAGVRELGEEGKPSTEAHFRIGSSTKTFTATLVLLLVADGRIELDGPVDDYLPEFGLDRRITVRMLLRHTSGVFMHTGEIDPDGTYVPGLPSIGQEWVDKRFETYRPEDLVRYALSRPARFEPGTDQAYSNTNYTLALLLVERVSGHSYAGELRRRIVEPLGLTGTSAPGDSAEIPTPYAHGYYRYEHAGRWKVVDVTRQNPSLLAGTGDLISTTRDLHTFVSALMAGKLLPDPLLAEMREPYGKLGYGLGLFVQDLGAGGTLYHHNGSTLGYGALMYATPDGSKTLTASLTGGDSDANVMETFPKALEKLVNAVFRTG